jgi:hypothetical protein
MDIRIDSKLAANSTSYRVVVEGDQAKFEKILRGWIRVRGCTCALTEFEAVLKRLTKFSVEDFSQSDLIADEDVWESLFSGLAPVQTSRWISDQTQHEPAWPGFVDCWQLTTKNSEFLRLDVSIFDHHDSNYHHDHCSHEAEAGIALKTLEIVGAKSHNHLIELAETFKAEDWKKLHDSIPSSQGCKWLNQWRG